MKRSGWISASVLLAALVISSAMGKQIYGFQDPGIGEYANVAPLKPDDWRTPPGHYGLMANYANIFLTQAASNGSFVVTWSYLKPLLTDYFVVDVRANSVYCAGHISGAINIPYGTVAQPNNLDKLPTDQPILVVCSTGHQSSQVGAILGMLGYQVRILFSGMQAVPPADRVVSCTP
jgi:rhodanese-related sulfurtransferase